MTDQELMSRMTGKRLNDPQVIVDLVRSVVAEEVQRMVDLITQQTMGVWKP